MFSDILKVCPFNLEQQIDITKVIDKIHFNLSLIANPLRSHKITSKHSPTSDNNFTML